MSLRHATLPGRDVPALPEGPPYACAALGPWADLDFELPPSDPRLLALHAGGREPTPPLANIAGNAMAWDRWPQHMDFLDPTSPLHEQKRLERALYEDRWDGQVPRHARVLDLGGGIGRFTQWCLDRRCKVELVDPDLRSLRRAVHHAAGRPGALDVHWATGETLPDLAPVDVAILAEVLCYAEDPALVLRNVRRVLKPGGVLLCSVEARWGWALAYDAPPGNLGALLGDGRVHIPGDKWVQTFTREELEALLSEWTIEEIVPTHYVHSGAFDEVAGPLTREELLDWEERLRNHPVTGPLNRAWAVIAR